MSDAWRVAVAGGGVAGLSAALHLVEIVAARPAGAPPLSLELTLVAQLVPDAESEGSGLGGKAMSRSFRGRFDEKHDGMDRQVFYGPMMPESGTIPHGYHILWAYPNLRRLLYAPGEENDPSLGGILRPLPKPGVPGGASAIPSFQALLDDPRPGGPGIGSMGLVDPDHPDSATRPATRELLRLRDAGLAAPFLLLFEALFGEVTGGLEAFAFADLFYAHEVDIELRLALIFSSITCRQTDPERTAVRVGDHDVPLTDVEYDTWAREIVKAKARAVGLTEEGLPGYLRRLLGVGDLLPDTVVDRVIGWLEDVASRAGTVGYLLESLLESLDPPEWLAHLLPAGVREHLGRYLFVYLETERVLREVPAALIRLGDGDYPVWRTLHFRFAPDATFASPRSFDGAQAVRSLQFCFLTPTASRMWSADGGKIQRLWLRLWRHLEARAAAAGVTLRVEAGRVDRVEERPDGVSVRWGEVLGHGTSGPHDLGFPWMSSLDPHPPPPHAPREAVFDAFVPAMPPALLEAILDPATCAPARAQLAPLRTRGNETLEILLWLDEAIDWSPAARDGLQQASITGLEGAFCLLADYRCGLWSDEELAASRPFGDDAPFVGSILESCGGMLDVFACLTRDDAYGWPAEAKAALAALLFRREDMADVATDPWHHVDDKEGWAARVADGTWSAARMADPRSHEDWIVASRWLAWGYLRQLSQIQSLGARAVRQLGAYAALLDPRGLERDTILAPPAGLLGRLRYVVMRNANRRSRFVNPGVGDWARRPISGLPLDGTSRVWAAGDWTRNGLDVVCMEGACLSGMRAARGAYVAHTGEAVPTETPRPIQVVPDVSWYAGVDPWVRGPGPGVGDAVGDGG